MPRISIEDSAESPARRQTARKGREIYCHQLTQSPPRARHVLRQDFCCIAKAPRGSSRSLTPSGRTNLRLALLPTVTPGQKQARGAQRQAAEKGEWKKGSARRRQEACQTCRARCARHSGSRRITRAGRAATRIRSARGIQSLGDRGLSRIGRVPVLCTGGCLGVGGCGPDQNERRHGDYRPDPANGRRCYERIIVHLGHFLSPYDHLPRSCPHGTQAPGSNEYFVSVMDGDGILKIKRRRKPI